MDKQAAENLISNTFNRPFNESNFSNFARNLLDDIDESKAFPYLYGNYIRHSFADHVKQYRRIGIYTDPNGERIDVLIVHLKRETALEHARTRQRNFIAWYLNGGRGGVLRDAALVAFVSPDLDDWRFSYVRMEYKEEVTESGKVRVKEELTPAKRYSFLVGKNEPNHTARQQLLPLLKNDSRNPTLSELEDAFSVEAVTKQFYLDYKGLFEKLTKELDHILEKDSKIKREFEARSIDTANFAKKLLGQIVFLYFLQKKGWLGVPNDERWGQGDKRFLGTLLKRCIAESKNFFNDYLEYLFYEALATTEGRATIDLSYYPKFDCKIPFLNGGLFEPINGYNWQETDIRLDNKLFAEIFDTFDRYNFTVKEDEPLEKEVAVDPEMLGKVFENLLPENLRKGQGAYYTPREIVHYMCQQSLINYLATEVSACHSRLTPCHSRGSGNPVPTKDDIENFIHKGEFAIEHDTAKEEGTNSYKYKVDESIRKNARLLNEKLETIKICDPAIGSGAFPVGMMHEIVKARIVLETYLKTGKRAYDFKRHCIQKSIYGVDIDPGAIEIAKLRLWLSLVVDEENYLDIKLLPNLDYKIMQGNSLIEDFHEVSLNLEKNDELLFSENEELDLLIEDLHRKQSEFFSAIHHSDKNRLREEVEDAIVKVFHYELKRRQEQYFKALDRINKMASGFPKEEDRKKCYDAEKAKLDKRYKFDFESVENELREMTHGNKIRNFFPWKLYFANVFRNNNGFDVVIANPPYISHVNYSKREKEIISRNSHTFKGRADLYVAFYEKGIDLLKKEGILTYITPNKFFRAGYGKHLRNYLSENTRIINVIDFGDTPIFDATTYPCIILLKNTNKSEREYSFNFLLTNNYRCLVESSNMQNFKKSYLEQEIWSFENQNLIKLWEKIKKGSITLDKYINNQFYRGIVTGLNEAFIIDEQKKQQLIAKNSKIAEIIKPYLRGRDVKRWNARGNSHIVFTYHGINIDDYKEILDYLMPFKEKLEKRATSKNHKWYELQQPQTGIYHHYEKPKIISTDIAKRSEFTIDLSNNYIDATIFCIPIQDLYLLTLLNSTLLEAYFKSISSTIRGDFLRFKKIYLYKMPIKKISLTDQKPFINFANQILSLKKSDSQADTSALEDEIDQMVYELYGLTTEEIGIVEKI